MIENEIKAIITKKQLMSYKEILDKLIGSQKKLQVNYYFDTEDLKLFKNGSTLRIRQINDNLKIQYKLDKEYVGLKRICKEYESSIQAFPKVLSLDIFEDLRACQTNYKYIGNLITERLDYFYDETIISLDTSYYLGKTDFEIEIEFEDDKKAENVLKILSIETLELQKNGKYKRFITEYLKN